MHLGEHHGLDGALLVATALLLLLAARALERRGLRVAVGIFASLMVVYGAAATLQDFWLEQLFKRGTTTLTLPGVLTPALSGAWAVLLVAAAVVYVGSSGPVRWESESPARSVVSSSSRRSSRWARTSSPCRTSPA